MIVSFAHRFVFIKTIKTAGSSIEVELSRSCEEAAVVTPLYPPEAGHQPRNFASLGFEPHMPAAAIRTRIGTDVWDDFTKITVERNPWDKMVSWYGWQRHLAGLECGFGDFIAECATRNRWPYLFPAASELFTVEGKTCLDRLIRFENLAEDFVAVFGAGFGLDSVSLSHAKVGHRPSGPEYREFYDPATIGLVARRYAREIELFGYVF